MKHHHDVKSFFSILSIVALVLPVRVTSQSVVDNLRNPVTRADYVIITPSAFLSAVQPLADLRRMQSGYSVAIVTTEAIYNIFGQNTTPDSAIRGFVTYTLTGGWAAPAPRFFLLAGNGEAVPSHAEVSIFPPNLGETFVLIDQWFVELAPDTIHPQAAIGRLPAGDATALATMVGKTIAYESVPGSAWFRHTLFVADNDTIAPGLFEGNVAAHQARLANVWSDTTTVYLRHSSPLYKSKEEFRSLWSQGAALVGLIGQCNWMQFSRSSYFTTYDVDSLKEDSPLAFCFLEGGQRFERTDTLCIASSLLMAPTKGAVATLAPSGLVFAGSQQEFFQSVFANMTENPTTPIGEIIRKAKNEVLDYINNRRQTLLGDPALVAKNPLLAPVSDPPPGTPSQFTLKQNYPNPFNPSTSIEFSIPYESFVSLKVYDLIGNEVATMVSEKLSAGRYTRQWNALGFPSGVYFYRMVAGSVTMSRKLTLIK